MDVNTTIDIDAVKAVVVETLGAEDSAGAVDTTTPLLGSVLELDSMAVLELEKRFGITEEGEEVTADGFETPTVPAAFVDDELR